MDNADYSLEKLLQHCSFVVAQGVVGVTELPAVDSFAVVTDKFEFLIADYLAFGDDAVVVESVAVAERLVEQCSSDLG